MIAEAKRGRFLVFEKDQYIGKALLEDGECLEEQAQLFELLIKPEAVVLDVGANIGLHTVTFGKIAKKVYAFEPQKRVFNALCGNLALNALDNVECFRVAGGEERGRISIGVCDYEIKNNFGALSMDDAGSEVVDVVPINIPCDFMKVDVEGWEAKVLRGSSKMIRERNPVLYVENDRKEKSDELVETVKDLGYKAYWHITPIFKSGGEPHSFDMLCLPKGIHFDKLPEVRLNDHPVTGTA